MALWLQYAIVAAAVLLSAWVVAKKQFPRALRRLRIAVALPLLRDGRPGWQRALGRRIAPEARAAGSANCGGCDNCG